MSYREKYFEGYQIRTKPDICKKGLKTIHEYEGDVYRLDMTDRQQLIKKFLCTGLILAFFSMGLAAGVQNVAANKGYAAVPYILALLSGCYCCLGIINMLIAHKDMTKFEYNEYTKQIRYGSVCTMYATGLAALIHLSFLIIAVVSGTSASLGNELLALLYIGVSCSCVAGIRQIEKKSSYIVISGILSPKSESSENPESEADMREKSEYKGDSREC